MFIYILAKKIPLIHNVYIYFFFISGLRALDAASRLGLTTPALHSGNLLGETELVSKLNILGNFGVARILFFLFSSTDICSREL